MQGNFICLLGFSKSTEDRIKAVMKEYSVPSLTWTTATAKELTGVVINASFLDTPQIHKYIKVVKAPVVSAYNTDAGHESAREYSNIPALDLRTNDENTIKNWLSKLLGSNYSTTNTSSLKNQGTQSSSYRELLDLILSKKIPLFVQSIMIALHGFLPQKKPFLSTILEKTRQELKDGNGWKLVLPISLTQHVI
ncbi:hypothetical protein [Rappaport israeli]|uniref:hypothetical protein n=1 Tax=Rappaport israeli TaxID=1839807 RepID=UPI000AAF3609|nr:hypothetical protein [Rappaport israeli]